MCDHLNIALEIKLFLVVVYLVKQLSANLASRVRHLPGI